MALKKKVEVIVQVPTQYSAPVTRSTSKDNRQNITAIDPKPVRPVKQTMEKYTDKLSAKDVEDLDQLFADFMFRCVIPFKVADSEALKNFIKRLRPAYKVPSAYKVSNTLLDSKYSDIKGKVHRILESSNTYTLISDGWTNIKGQHLVNFIVQIPGHNPFFYKAIDTSAIEMTAENIAKLVIDIAKEISIAKWTALLTDNAPVMQKVWKIIESQYPLVFGNGCAAHVGNLIIKRICNQEVCVTLLESCTKVIKFTNNHTRILSKFQECQGLFNCKTGLALPEPTRFYTQSTCTKSLLSNKKPIQHLFDEYEEFVDKIGKPEVREAVKKIVNDVGFWKNLRILVDEILQPFVKFISNLESDSSRLDQIYDNFLSLKSYFERLELRDCFEKDVILDEIHYYWGYMHTESMGFAFILNPKNLHRLDKMEGNDYEDSVDRLEKYLKKYYESEPERASSAVRELTKYFVSYAESSDKYKVRKFNAIKFKLSQY